MSFEMITAINQILSNSDRVQGFSREKGRRRDSRRKNHPEESSETERYSAKGENPKPLPLETLAPLRLNLLRQARALRPEGKGPSPKERSRREISARYLQGCSFARWSVRRPDAFTTEG